MAYRQRYDSQAGSGYRSAYWRDASGRPPVARRSPSGGRHRQLRPSTSKPHTTKNRPKKSSPQPPSGGLFSAKLVAALFFIFVFVYIGHAIFSFWTPTIDTMILRMSTLDVHQSVMGVIVRDEHVHIADRDGHIEFHVQDNEWVAVGAFVASVGDMYMADAAAVRLVNVEDQAMDLQDRRQPISVVDSEVQRINNSIANTANARIHSFATLNLSEIYSLHDQLGQAVNTRNQINIDDGVAAMGLLAREQYRHTAVLELNSRNMYASTSGIMSRVIDGNEAILTRAGINDLTREDVRDFTDYSTFVNRQDIYAGDAAFRIVGNTWYIVAELPNEMISGFEAGSHRTIYLYNERIGDYEAHRLRIQSIDYGTRYGLVVFRSTRHVTDFINQRNVSIRTTSGVQRGLKVPCTAISTRQYVRLPLSHIHGTDETYVIISGESGNITIPVEIENITEHYAYVTTVTGLGIGNLLVPHDSNDVHILLTDENIRELHGVYVDNLGIAEFRLVNLGVEGIAVGYILLDSVLNPNLREFINIIVDASTVTEGQLIRQ